MTHMSKSSKRIKGSYQSQGNRVFDYSYLSKEDANQKAYQKWQRKFGSPQKEQRYIETLRDLAVTLYQPTILTKGISTYNAYWRDSYKRHIEPAIGWMAFGDIRKHHMVTLLNGIKSYSVKLNVKIVLKAIIAEGEFNNVPLGITKEAVASIDIGKRPLRQPLKISAEDLKLKQATCPWELLCPMILASVLGLRKGEIIGLQWKDIDTERTELTVARQVYKNGSTGLPKSGKPRTYQVSKEFIELLHTYGNIDSNVVCTAASGKPWSHTGLGAAWKALGFPKGVGLHQARHFAATMLANTSGSMAASAILGHGSITTTDRYLHPEVVGTENAVQASTELIKSVVTRSK